jgi:hypothetical protein
LSSAPEEVVICRVSDGRLFLVFLSVLPAPDGQLRAASEDVAGSEEVKVLAAVGAPHLPALHRHLPYKHDRENY